MNVGELRRVIEGMPDDRKLLVTVSGDEWNEITAIYVTEEYVELVGADEEDEDAE
jgi:hypothetical protein